VAAWRFLWTTSSASALLNLFEQIRCDSFPKHYKPQNCSAVAQNRTNASFVLVHPLVLTTNCGQEEEEEEEEERGQKFSENAQRDRHALHALAASSATPTITQTFSMEEPTLLDRTSWQQLPVHMKELMDETMAFMDEEAAQQARQALLQGGGASRAAVTLPVRRMACSTGQMAQQVSSSVQPPSFQQTVPAPAAAAFGHESGQPVAHTPQQRKRATLDAATVIQIYQARHSNEVSSSKSANLSRRLAKQHGVTEKAVRDIWIARTWKAVTQPYRN